MDFVTDTNFHSDVSERIRIKGQVSRDGHVSNQTTRLIFNKCQKISGDPVEVECMQDADLAFWAGFLRILNLVNMAGSMFSTGGQRRMETEGGPHVARKMPRIHDWWWGTEDLGAARLGTVICNWDARSRTAKAVPELQQRFQNAGDGREIVRRSDRELIRYEVTWSAAPETHGLGRMKKGRLAIVPCALATWEAASKADPHWSGAQTYHRPTLYGGQGEPMSVSPARPRPG
jgi:hypothetical protein